MEFRKPLMRLRIFFSSFHQAFHLYLCIKKAASCRLFNYSPGLVVHPESSLSSQFLIYLPYCEARKRWGSILQMRTIKLPQQKTGRENDITYCHSEINYLVLEIPLQCHVLGSFIGDSTIQYPCHGKVRHQQNVHRKQLKNSYETLKPSPLS